VAGLFAGNFFDANGNTLAGVAIVGNAAGSAAATQGKWQYSTSNGNSWTDVPASPSTSAALMLATTARLRFVPVKDFSGSPGALSARLIDSSFGTVSSGSLQAIGTSTAISANAVPLTTTVTPRATAATLRGAATLGQIAPSATTGNIRTVSQLVRGVATSSQALPGGLAIVNNAATSAQGSWQYSTDGGITWVPIPSNTETGGNRAIEFLNAAASKIGSNITEATALANRLTADGKTDTADLLRSRITLYSQAQASLTDLATQIGDLMAGRIASIQYGTTIDGAPILITKDALPSLDIFVRRLLEQSGSVGVAKPTVPTKVTGAPGDGRVTLTWNPPSFAGTAPITDYTIQYSSDNGVNWSTFSHDASTAVTATITSLFNGSDYVFRVAAVNAVGQGGFSAISVPVSPTKAATAPAAPTGLQADPGSNHVRLFWTPPVSDGGSPVTDYSIEYSANGGSAWLPFSDDVSIATSATVTGLTNGTSYVFRVTAINTAGTGTPSAASAAAKPVAATVVPGVPTNVQGIAGQLSVNLSWTAPLERTGATITDFAIQYSSDAGGSWNTFPHTASTATAATVTGLMGGTSYIFRVAAVNAAGTGAYSVVSAAVTPVAASASPTLRAMSLLSLPVASSPLSASDSPPVTATFTSTAIVSATAVPMPSDSDIFWASFSDTTQAVREGFTFVAGVAKPIATAVGVAAVITASAPLATVSAVFGLTALGAGIMAGAASAVDYVAWRATDQTYGTNGNQAAKDIGSQVLDWTLGKATSRFMKSTGYDPVGSLTGGMMDRQELGDLLGNAGLKISDQINSKTLSGITDAIKTGVDAAIDRVTDDVTPITVSLNLGSRSVSEAAGSVDVVISLSRASTQPIQIGYFTKDGTAKAGMPTGGGSGDGATDYLAGVSTLVFAPRETRKLISVPLWNDDACEGTETFSFNLGGKSGGVLYGTYTKADIAIIDDDAPITASLATATRTVSESAGKVDLTIMLSRASSQPIEIDYRTSDGTAKAGSSAANGSSDYQSTFGTVTFMPGETSKTVTISIWNDDAYESDEAFRFDLISKTDNVLFGATTRTDVTIANDDAKPTVSVDGSLSVTEAAGWAYATVSLSRATQVPVTVNWSTSNGSAVAGADFGAASGLVTFESGQTSKRIGISIYNDSVYENNKAFYVTLSSPSGAVLASTQCTITIINDDPMPSLWDTQWTVTESSHPSFLETWYFPRRGYYYEGFSIITVYVNGLDFWLGVITEDTNAPSVYWNTGGRLVSVGRSYHYHAGSLDPFSMRISGNAYLQNGSSKLYYTFYGNKS